MIKRHIVISVAKERLDMADKKYMEHLYLEAAHDFAIELAKHIEPAEIIEQKDLNVATLHFELQGGSLPDHESDT